MNLKKQKIVTTANGEQQDIYKFDYYTKCAAIIVPRGSDRRFQQHTSKTQLTIKPETCWNVVWPPLEKPQEQEPTCGLVHEKKRHPRKYENNTSSLLWKFWIDNEVFDLVDLRKFKPKNHVTDRWVLTIKTVKQGNFLRQR